ncbi:MAG: phosphosulfolactate synthase [Bacillaceae bacterium]|nr:phosphosulfolactate synthase [Bacillaceae bacterium]
MQTNINSTWSSTLADPSACRVSKPRKKGVTVVIDKGLGLHAFQDILETAAPFIDFIKLGFGTSALYPDEILQKKVALADQHQVAIYPGGTFFEVATVKGKLEDYLNTVKKIGFSAVEISDGTIEISRKYRSDSIHLAREMGFVVLSEYGKKVQGSRVDIDRLAETFYADTQSGASYMIVEGRESGKNVGIYDRSGVANIEVLQHIQERLGEQTESLIWEAPHKDQQVQLLEFFGPQVNLGNVASHDVYSIESLRRGLRSDTFTFGL